MSINKYIYFILSLLVFLVSPIFSLPLILIMIFEKKKGAILLISFFMGYVSYMVKPSILMDLSRYYEYYETFDRGSYNDFIFFLSRQPDKLYYIFLYIGTRLGLRFQEFLFIITTFNFYVILSLYDYFTKTLQLKKTNNFFSFIVYFLSVSFLYYLMATRFTFATSFFLICLISYFKKKYVLFIAFFILAIFTHTSFLFFIPIILLVHFLGKRKKIFYLIILLGLVVNILPTDLLFSIFSLNEGFSKKVGTYMSLERQVSIIPVISHTLFVCLAIVVYINLYKYAKRGNEYCDQLFNLFSICLLGILFTIFQGYIVVDRFIMICKPIFLIVFIVMLNYNMIKNKLQLKFIYGLCIVVSLFYVSIIYKGTFNNLLDPQYLLTPSIIELNYHSSMFK